MSYSFKENPNELLWWKWQLWGNEEIFIVPDQFTELSEFSFQNPETIKKLYLHKKVKKIRQGTFKGFTNIESIEVHPENKTFYVEDGILFKKAKINGNDLIQLELYPAEKKGDSYTIPDNVSCISSWAFANTKYLKKLTLSDNLSPNDEPFYNMGDFSKTIEDVVIPSISVYALIRKNTTIYPSQRGKREKGCFKFYKENDCIFSLSGDLSVITPRYRPKFNKKLLRWDEKNGGELAVFHETKHLPDGLLDDSEKFDSIIYPKFGLFWSDYKGELKSKSVVPLTFPRIDFRATKDADTKFSLLLGYLAHPEFYNDDSLLTSGRYLPYVLNQKHKILPYIYKIDRPDLLEFYAERNCITAKNIEKVFLNPAIEAGADKCVEYLKKFKDEYLMHKLKTEETFFEEKGITYAVRVSTKANSFLHQKCLVKCDENVSGDVYIPYNTISIEETAFDGCESISSIIAPKFYVEKFDYVFNNGAIVPLVFPMIHFNSVKNATTKINLLLGYLAHPEYYEDCITGFFMENTRGEDYLEYVITQKKKLLPHIFKLDRDDMLEFYALRGEITARNFEKGFLNPAKEMQAKNCIKFLKDWEAENL